MGTIIFVLCNIVIFYKLLIMFFFPTYCRLMDGNSTSGTKTFGSSFASSRPSLLDSTMPPIDNDNVEYVGVGSTAAFGTQNPSSALPPKPKRFEQTSVVLEHFTKVEGG